MVSHDRYMLDRMTNQVLGFDGKGNAEFFADYSQWLRSLKEKKSVQKKNSKPQKTNAADKDSSQKKKPGKLSYRDQFELDHIEEKIQESEIIAEELENKLNEPEIAGTPESLSAHCEKLKKAQDLVETLYQRWEYLEQLKEE